MLHQLSSAVGSFIGKWLIIITLLTIMSVPVEIIRSTVFADTLCIQILYTDGHEDYKFVLRSDYANWLHYHETLHTKFAGDYNRSDITATTQIYNVFTGNNK